MVILPDYLADIAKEMRARSASIRRDFASHRPTAGEGREDIVADFLSSHLPKRFAVTTGIVISADGEFSNQADLLVVDHLNNAPLYGGHRSPLWPVESVYALIEVKSYLSPDEINNSMQKCRRFNKLRRQFCETGQARMIDDSLFVLWAFAAPATMAVHSRFLAANQGVPLEELPDFVVVPDKFVFTMGRYLQYVTVGQPGSSKRMELERIHKGDVGGPPPGYVQVNELNENALMAWYVWFDSWLRLTGPRMARPSAYLPLDRVFGTRTA